MFSSILNLKPQYYLAVIALNLFLVGCAVPTGTISDKTLSDWNNENIPNLFKSQDPLSSSLSISEAIARALKYNLQKKVAILEEELSEAEAAVETYGLYPSIVIGGRLSGRSNPPISNTKDINTGRVTRGRTYASSLYPLKADVDTQVSWNFLNLAVSVIKSRQATDRSKIATERRRKAVQEIINEVQISFWQAAASQRLTGDVERLLPRVDESIALRRREENNGSRPPLESLAEQRTLLELKRQLLAIHNSLVNAKATLANLIGIRPGTDFKLNLQDAQGLPNIELGVDALERYGLNNRPELIEEAYADRIANHDVISAVLSTLPSVNIQGGYNLTFDTLVKNKTWANYGVRLTYNLLNLSKGISGIVTSNKRKNLINKRRLAVAMSVLTQVRLSWLNYWQAREQYQAAVDFANVESRILQNVQSLSASGSVGELELIRGYMNALIGELNKDLAFADLRASLNRLLISAGADPTPESLASSSIEDISTDIKHALNTWQHKMLANMNWQNSQTIPANNNLEVNYSDVSQNPWKKWQPSKQIASLLKSDEHQSWDFDISNLSVSADYIPLAPISKIISKPIQLLSFK